MVLSLLLLPVLQKNTSQVETASLSWVPVDGNWGSLQLAYDQHVTVKRNKLVLLGVTEVWGQLLLQYNPANANTELLAPRDLPY